MSASIVRSEVAHGRLAEWNTPPQLALAERAERAVAAKVAERERSSRDRPTDREDKHVHADPQVVATMPALPQVVMGGGWPSVHPLELAGLGGQQALDAPEPSARTAAAQQDTADAAVSSSGGGAGVSAVGRDARRLGGIGRVVSQQDTVGSTAEVAVRTVNGPAVVETPRAVAGRGAPADGQTTQSLSHAAAHNEGTAALAGQPGNAASDRAASHPALDLPVQAKDKRNPGAESGLPTAGASLRDTPGQPASRAQSGAMPDTPARSTALHTSSVSALPTTGSEQQATEVRYTFTSWGSSHAVTALLYPSKPLLLQASSDRVESSLSAAKAEEDWVVERSTDRNDDERQSRRQRQE